MKAIKVTYEYQGEIKTEKHTLFEDDAKSIREAFALALKYETGVGHEEYFASDNPEVLEHKILKIELVEE